MLSCSFLTLLQIKTYKRKVYLKSRFYSRNEIKDSTITFFILYLYSLFVITFSIKEELLSALQNIFIPLQTLVIYLLNYGSSLLILLLQQLCYMPLNDYQHLNKFISLTQFLLTLFYCPFVFERVQ